MFRPPQKSLHYVVDLKMPDNNTNTLASLDCKEYVKYLWDLIDSNLTWKHHIDYIVGKVKL